MHKIQCTKQQKKDASASYRLFYQFWEKTWYLYSWITQGTSYLNARAYAILHRMHHAYSDTEKDPHTPHFFKEVFTMMMHTRKVYNGVLHGTMEIEKN